MNVVLLTPEQDFEAIVATAARTCYSSEKPEDIFDSFRFIQDTKKAEIIRTLKKRHHETPFEHVSFTFAISGISRVTLAQLTRHRLASFSVQSQRYSDFSNNEPVIPEFFETFEETRELIFRDYQAAKDFVKTYYVKELHMSEKDAEKKAQEDARYILPQCESTNVVMTMNARELMHFFNLRCCNRAQWEIRQLANEILRICKKVAPIIFEDAGPSCVRGACPEGEYGCGNPVNRS